jgi:hypothetical protein
MNFTLNNEEIFCNLSIFNEISFDKEIETFFIPPPPLSTTTESSEEDPTFPLSSHYFLNKKHLPPKQEQSFTLLDPNSALHPKESSIHTKYYFDNILRKIKVLYHQFLIHFINNCIKKQFPTMKTLSIKKLDGKRTQDITLSHNKTLLQYTLKEILLQFVSRKYTDIVKHQNEKNINYIINESNEMKRIFDMTYEMIYSELFLNENKSIIDYKYKDALNKSPTLRKFVINSNERDCAYWEKVNDIARNKYISYFLNTKMRKPKKKKM